MSEMQNKSGAGTVRVIYTVVSMAMVIIIGFGFYNMIRFGVRTDLPSASSNALPFWGWYLRRYCLSDAA